MLYDGLVLSEGTSITNATVASGTSFPSNPSTGELFFRTDLDALHVYDGSGWVETGAGGAGDVTLAGNNAFTGDNTFAGVTQFQDVASGITPTADAHLATKAYVDSVAAGLDPKGSVRAATTANITLSGAQTIDGVSIIAGDRVLVKDQSTATQNGIYVAASGAWARAADFDGTPAAEVSSGAFTFVTEGTVNGDKGFVLTTNDPITLGSTSLTWTQFSSSSSVSLTATQVGFGSAGGALTGSSNFTWVDSTNTLTLGNTDLNPTIKGLTGGVAGHNISLIGGVSSSNVGGYVYVQGGNGSGSNAGGNIFLQAGGSGTGTGGNLDLQAGTGGTGGYFVLKTGASATERLRVLANGAWSIGTGGTATGTAGQVLTSNGSGSAPTWQAASGGASVAGTADGQIQYKSGSSLAASSALSYSSNTLTVGPTNAIGIITSGQALRLTTPNATTGNPITMYPGDASGSGETGAALTINAGNGTAGYGGALTIRGGRGDQNGATGGTVTIKGGEAPTGTGGNLILAGGEQTSASSGTLGGDVILRGGYGQIANGGSIRHQTMVSGGSAWIERFTISRTGEWLLGASQAAGTAGQVLTSNGSGTAPTWQTVSAGAATSLAGTGAVSGPTSNQGTPGVWVGTSASQPYIAYYNSGAPTGQRYWDFYQDTTNGTLHFRGGNDGVSTFVDWLTAVRGSGSSTVATLTLTATSIAFPTSTITLAQGTVANATTTIKTANSTASGAQPNLTIQTGDGAGGLSGAGTLTLQGGAGPSGGSQGGDIVINGGNVTAGSGQAGRVLITTGTGTTAGYLQLTTGGTERLRVLSNGAWSVGTAGTATGTSGQVLTSNGSGSAPTWQTVSATFTGGTVANATTFTSLVTLNSGATFTSTTALPVNGTGGSLQIGYLNNAITSVQDAFVAWTNGTHALATGGGHSANGTLVLAARNVASAGISLATLNEVRMSIRSDGRIQMQAGWSDTKNAPAFSGTPTIDCAVGNSYALTMTNDITSLAFSNVPAAGNVFTLTMFLTQDSTGGRTIAWPASVKFSGGAAVVLTTTPTKTDIIQLVTHDGGTTWYATVVGMNF